MSKTTNVLKSTVDSPSTLGREPASLISIKLQPWHWERHAIVSVRQSSPQQVLENSSPSAGCRTADA